MKMLEGKVAIVTGAGNGLGRAHALELAKHGAKVVVNDLGGSARGEGSGSAAQSTVDLIHERGGEAVANFADVGDHDAAGALIAQAVDTYGRLDVLVNNAGIVRDAAVWNMPVDDFDIVMRVHVRGTWSCSHHAARHWRARAKAGESFQGRIINTTSGAGLTGNFGQTNYATAKAAIVGMTQTLAIELKAYGVTANCLGPAGATRITASMPGRDEIINPEDIPEGEYHPMNPANCSPIVAWLASDGSSLVTGQVIRSVYDTIYWMHGWREAASVSAGEKVWDATQLQSILAARLFGTGVDSLLFR